MNWTITDRSAKIVPPRTDRYYNILHADGKMTTACPIMDSDNNGERVEFWFTNNEAINPYYIIAFSEPIELSEELLQLLKPTCMSRITKENYYQ